MTDGNPRLSDEEQGWGGPDASDRATYNRGEEPRRRDLDALSRFVSAALLLGLVAAVMIVVAVFAISVVRYGITMR